MLTVRDGRAADLREVITLLERMGLSGEGVPQRVDDFLVAREHGHLVAVAGLEGHGTAGLLRSVAVTPARQNRGLARYLTSALIERAKERQLSAIYLLTTDAQRYFERHGFRPIDRNEVSPAIADSTQFKAESCATATVMMLDLTTQTAPQEG
jgi:amino-acid N-acetyltransferase